MFTGILPHNGRNFYPRSPCGERLCYLDNIEITQAISIHALLAESDDISFNIFLYHATFLSTLSLRRATTQSQSLFA